MAAATPMWQFNLDPMCQYPFGSNTNKFVISSVKRKFTYQLVENIGDPVLNQGSPITM